MTPNELGEFVEALDQVRGVVCAILRKCMVVAVAVHAFESAFNTFDAFL